MSSNFGFGILFIIFGVLMFRFPDFFFRYFDSWKVKGKSSPSKDFYLHMRFGAFTLIFVGIIVCIFSFFV